PSTTWAQRYSKAGKDHFCEVREALVRSREEFEESERERAAAARAEREAREGQLKLAAAQAQAEAETARACAAEERAKAAAAAAAVALVALAAPFGMKFYNNRMLLQEKEQQIAQQTEKRQSLIINAAE